jgi:hypothetical protein
MEAELAGFILWGIKTIFHLFQKKMKTTSFLLLNHEKFPTFKDIARITLVKRSCSFGVLSRLW